MEFTWQYTKKTPQSIKSFLKEQGVSKKLLAKIKFQGGKIEVNQQEKNVLFLLSDTDRLTITIPTEAAHETLLVDPAPISIIYEDAHLLVVNKPAGVPSIPAQYHPNQTMANRVKAYYQKQGYANQVVHLVTRLDKDTSGLMLFAKHGFAHALMDQQLRQKQVIKNYQALVWDSQHVLASHAEILFPIARDRASLIKRKVSADGQLAQTEYWLHQKKANLALVAIRLHTGRTHQIRVHFEALGCPLVGDSLYGGAPYQGLQRQALHCHKLGFAHPFTKENMWFEAALPNDMAEIMQDFAQE